MSNLDILKDKTITAVFVSNDNEHLRIDTDDDIIYFFAYGDCCSVSWIENVELLGDLGKVVSVEDLDIPEAETKDDDYLQFYGLSIKMLGGTIDIDYRNSSNGYYGGVLVGTGAFDYEAPDADTKWRVIK